MKKRRNPRPSKNPLPKGAYRLPEGGVMGKGTSKTYVTAGKSRRITVRPVYRDEPDLDRFARLLVRLASDQLADESSPNDSAEGSRERAA